MSHLYRVLRPPLSLFALTCCLAVLPAVAGAVPCQVADDGSGTVSLPPPNCGYLSPADLHVIINGLPPGTTIKVGAQHERFFNITHSPGGSLGGEVETFQSQLRLHLQGTGTMSGYTRDVVIPNANCQTHIGPRTPGAAVQSFDTDMFGIQGQLPPGDPDFDLLRITAGTGFGMPSPGHTTLTRLGGVGSNWNIDSFFDITYRIDFVGRAGGPFGGMSGSTTATIRMGTGEPNPGQCIQPDASGTVNLPPVGCGYVSPADVHMILNGLPPGTTVRIGAEHNRFFNITRNPGGSLGGEVEQFSSNLQLELSGTGSMAGYQRDIVLANVQCETHTGPRSPGTPVQSFDTDMFRIQGQLPPGDPDFDLLRITAGTAFGMPSPGHTTLTRQADGNWNVDSFFDITYRIDFVGRPGGPFGGMSGSTTGTIRMGSGIPSPGPCVQPDAGGTVILPPAGCGYLSPADVHRIIDGLPAGTTIRLGAEHREFFNSHSQPGGSLGGEVEDFGSFLQLDLNGTGSLAGFSRTLQIQAQCQTHTAPRTPGTPVQSFDTDMFMLQGQLPPGDPDFDLLRITAGSAFGMPSPGHTTLTSMSGAPGVAGPGGQWNVDSFFDITYRIDFVGRAGGPLGGMSGSTTGTIRMQAGQPVTTDVPTPRRPGKIELTSSPNPFGKGTSLAYRLNSAAHVKLRVYDAAGKLVRTLTDDRLPAGPHAMYWDGRSDAGRKLGSGTYFVKITVDGQAAGTRRTTLIR